MWRHKIKCHRGHLLTREQIAIAAVIAEAIGKYSEDNYCAGWLHGIEHELWERIFVRKPDAYERAVKKLYNAAGEKQKEWGKPNAEFLAGLKILARRYQVWIYYNEAETAIHLKDWLPLHENRIKRLIQDRPSLEKVWQWMHEPFPRLKAGQPVRIPPMPKLR